MDWSRGDWGCGDCGETFLKPAENGLRQAVCPECRSRNIYEIDPDEEYEEWDEYDAEPPDPDVCFNCGCPGRNIEGGEYECPECGNIWDIYTPAPEVP